MLRFSWDEPTALEGNLSFWVIQPALRESPLARPASSPCREAGADQPCLPSLLASAEESRCSPGCNSLSQGIFSPGNKISFIFSRQFPHRPLTPLRGWGRGGLHGSPLRRAQSRLHPHISGVAPISCKKGFPLPRAGLQTASSCASGWAATARTSFPISQAGTKQLVAPSTATKGGYSVYSEAWFSLGLAGSFSALGTGPRCQPLSSLLRSLTPLGLQQGSLHAWH